MKILSTVITLIADTRSAIAAQAGIPPVRRQLYAQLGDIPFEVVGPIVGLEGRRAYTYAQHAVVRGKPRLQAIGDELEVLTLTLSLNETLSDPVTMYADLCAAAAKHVAMPFVFTGGQFLGRYVISEIGDTTDETDASGRVTRRQLKITLTEWVEGEDSDPTTRARQAQAKANTAAAPKTQTAGLPIHSADPDSVPIAQLIRSLP